MPVKDDRGSRVPIQADFDRMIIRHKSEIEKLCNRLAGGKITLQEWQDGFFAVLAEGHTDAWVLGRRLGGDGRAKDTMDAGIGLVKADLEGDYLNDFLQALRSPGRPARDGGLYDDEGGLKTGKVINRAQSYTGKMRATASEAFVEASDPLEEYNWVLGAVEEHCDECPLWADMGPFVKESLPIHPGDGSTPCLGNCTCRLVRVSDGRSMFSRAA